MQHLLGRVSSNQGEAQRHYTHICYTEFQSNRTTRVESTDRNIFTPLKYGFHPPIINVCVHLLYEILSKSDVKCTKYELNFIYVRKYSTAFSLSRLSRNSPLFNDIYWISIPISVQIGWKKNVRKLSNISRQCAFHCTICTTLEYCLKELCVDRLY